MYAVIFTYNLIPETVDVFPTESAARHYIEDCLTRNEYDKPLPEGHFWDNGIGFGVASNAYNGGYWRYGNAEIRLMPATSHKDI